jgi:[ribosomal protein S5]-alanine N-acetyltransferase
MQPGDAEDAFALNSDPDVLRYTGDVPFASVEEARQFLANYDAYEKWGYGRLNCYRKDTGEYIGWCGLKYHPAEDETDLGYRLKKDYWNQGYATEASAVCLQYGFEKLDLPFIVARILSENRASIKVAEKLGMRFWKEADFHEQPGLCYRLTREDYFSRPPVN